MIVRCPDCGTESSTRTAQSACDECDGLLAVEHAPTGSGAALRALFDERALKAMRTTDAQDRSGVWRFREIVLDASAEEVVSHPEGNTPLLHRSAAAEYTGVD